MEITKTKYKSTTMEVMSPKYFIYITAKVADYLNIPLINMQITCNNSQIKSATKYIQTGLICGVRINLKLVTWQVQKFNPH